MITLKDLFNLTEFDDVFDAIRKYAGEKYSYEKMKSVFDSIRNKPETKNNDFLILSYHAYGQPDSDSFTYVMFGHKEDDPEKLYSLSFYPWIKLANSRISDETLKSFSQDPGFLASLYLYEATWFGYTEEAIERKYMKDGGGNTAFLFGGNIYSLIR